MGIALSQNRRSIATSFALVIAAFSLVATIVSLGPRLLARGSDTPVSNPTDFRAFYCGGSAIRAGADPYRVEPLMSCERTSLESFGLSPIPNFVLPAPLPPFALASLVPISALPFPVASVFWFVLAMIAIIATIVGIGRLAPLPLWTIALPLLGADAYASLVIGQIVPFVVCALVGAALALRSGRYTLATVALGVAAIEPHIALPVIAAAFAIVPQMRLRVAALCAVLAGISLASVGFATCVEYATRVLPAHARSEIAGFGAQYSLSSLLYAYGVGETAAIRLGEIAYAVVALGAIALAARIAAISRDLAYVVLIPAAFAPLGGVFVHIHQMAAAVPLALMLVAVSRRGRGLVLAAVIALAVPWESIAETPTVVNLYARGHAHASPVLGPVDKDALAEEPEVAYMHAGGSYYDGRSKTEMLLWKFPTWFALVGLLALTIFRARRTVEISRFQAIATVR